MRSLTEPTNCYGQIIHPVERNPVKYMSNHVLVNRVRIEKNLPKLRRSRYLDALASDYAREAAKLQHFHCSQHTIDELRDLLGSDRVGQNLCRGSTMIEMHNVAMEKGGPPRNNILSKNFKEFGMGTSMSEDGKLYMVQFFRGEPMEGGWLSSSSNAGSGSNYSS